MLNVIWTAERIPVLCSPQKSNKLIKTNTLIKTSKHNEALPNIENVHDMHKSDILSREKEGAREIGEVK